MKLPALVGALVALSIASPAQAFVFLMLGAQNRDKPSPTEIESHPVNPPAPVPQAELPVPHLARPVVPTLPARQELAQTSADELMRRLERLEQENQELRRRLDASPGSAATEPVQPSTGPRHGIQSDPLPPQMGAGSWWLHLHPFNTDGAILQEPIYTYRYPDQPFSAAVGVSRGPYGMSGTEMYVFRLEGFLTIQKAGTYQLGFEINCGFEHPCNVSMKVGGQEILAFRNTLFNNQLRYTARELTPGRYQVEIIYGIAKTQFIQYQPARVTLHPKIRPAGEMNFRALTAEELAVPDRRDVPPGPAFSVVRR